MKFVHIADLHFGKNKEKAKKALASMHTLQVYVSKTNINGVLISGDIWDAPILNTETTYFDEYIECIQNLTNYCPVYMIQGTVTHDANGSLEIFKMVKTYKHKIHVLSYGDFVDATDYVVFGIPELQRDEFAKTKNQVFDKVWVKAQEFPNVPKILLYHGQIQGAKYNAYMSVEPADHIPKVIDFNVLRMDYIAMGDIHLPQKIDGINAYYSGSIYPCNWGESHQCGFNVVTIENGKTTVETVDFPHAVQKKMVIDITEMSNLDTAFFADNSLWIEVKGTQEEFSARITEFEKFKTRTQTLLSHESRVTFSVIPSDTVRVKEIAETKKITDKVKLYYDSSNLIYTLSITDKVELLEKEFTLSGHAHVGSRFRVTKLFLRGAIGIWKKSRLNEITIDLENVDSGLIALVGANGSGKTTIIENMHPWSCVFTRDGKLSDNFRLRDSVRDLYLIDEITGAKYRCLLNITAGIQNPSIEYFLYQSLDGSKWETVSGITGRKDDYDAVVQSIFGSMEMYQRSAFIKQKSTKNLPELSEATRSQRMDLLTELCGFDYLETYKALCTTKLNAVKAEYSTVYEKIRFAGSTPETQAVLEGEEKSANDSMIMSQSNLLLITHKMNECKAELDELKATEKKYDSIRSEILVEQSVLNSMVKKSTDIELEINTLSELKNHRETYQAKIDTHLEQSMENAKIAETNKTIYAEYRNQVSIVEAENAQINEQIESIKTDIFGLSNSINKVKLSVSMAENDIKQTSLRTQPINDNCPTCNQKLPKETIEKLNGELEKFTEQLSQEKAKLLSLQEGVELLEAEKISKSALLETLKTQRKELPKAPSDTPTIAPTMSNPQYEFIMSQLANIKNADDRIVKLDAELQAVKSMIDTSKAKMNSLASLVDPTVTMNRSEKELEFERISMAFRECNDTTVKLRTELEGLRRAVQKGKEELAKIELLKSTLEALNVESTEWSTLCEAFGSKGIQALELDAIAPNIAMIANSILREAYGEKYTIQLKTTRTGGKGSNTKQIEDVLIMVYDNDDGSEQELSTLSGGETVWINKALHDAFAIIRNQNSGISFSTAFYDESDGKLDPESKEFYMRMLQEAHNRSNRHHTIIISHDQSVQAMIPNKLHVGAK